MRKKNVDFIEEIKNSEQFLQKVIKFVSLVGIYKKIITGYQR
jgi:hypothetical protein